MIFVSWVWIYHLQFLMDFHYHFCLPLTGIFWPVANRREPICGAIWYRISSLESGQMERRILGCKQHRNPLPWSRSKWRAHFWIINCLVLERGIVFKVSYTEQDSSDERASTAPGSLHSLISAHHCRQCTMQELAESSGVTRICVIRKGD